MCIRVHTENNNNNKKKRIINLWSNATKRVGSGGERAVCALPTAAFFRVFTPVCVRLSVGLRVSPCVSVFEEARIYTYIKGGRPEEACNQPNCKVVVFLSFFLIFLFLSCYFWPAE